MWPASVLDAAHCWATMLYWRRQDQLAAGGAVLHGAQQLHVQVHLLETELVGEVVATEVQEEAGRRRDGPRKCRSRGDGGGPDRACGRGEAGVTKAKVVGLGVGKLNSIAKWVPAPPGPLGRPASIRSFRLHRPRRGWCQLACGSARAVRPRVELGDGEAAAMIGVAMRELLRRDLERVCLGTSWWAMVNAEAGSTLALGVVQG